MKNLRTRFNRFCLRNRDKGIPNLMLYIALGNAIVILMSMINGGGALYQLLCFDKNKILQGQIWRLFTYVFTQSGSGFLDLLFLYFFYMLGRYVEMSMGTLKFNLFYLSGVLLMDIFAMLFCPTEPVLIGNTLYLPEVFVYGIYGSMAFYLHLSLVLAFATTNPDAQFMIFFIIPIKAWVMAVFYLVLIGIEVFNLAYPTLFFPHCLFPLVGLANYFLFFACDMSNLLPLSWRVKLQGRKKAQSGPKVITFQTKTGPYKTAEKNYTHKCTVCGVTDVDDPNMEFRYCSRCQGYHCYCIEHINNHTHVE